MADEPVMYDKVYYIHTKLTEKFPIIPYRTVGMIDTNDAVYCMCQVTSSTGNYEIYKLDIPSDGLTPIYDRTLTWKSAAVLSYSDYGYIYHYQKPNYYRMNDKDADYKYFIVTGNKLYFSDDPVGPFTKATGDFLTSTAPSNIVYAYSKYCIIYQYRLYSSTDGVIWEIANANLYDKTNYQGLFILNNQLVAAVVGLEYLYILIETTGSLPGTWKEYKYLNDSVEGAYKGNYIESVNDLLLNEICGEDIIVISKMSNNYFSYQFHLVNFKDGLPTGSSGENFYSPYVTDANNGFSLIHSSKSYKNEYFLCSESKLNDVKPALSIYSKLDAYNRFTDVSTDTSSSSNNLYTFQLDTPTGFHVSKNCDYVISYPTDSSEYIKEKRVIDVDPYIFVAAGGNKGLYYSTNGKVWTQSNITSGDIYTVYNANSIWVAGSYSKGLYYSTDGKVWSQSNITSGSYYHIYYANGIWVAGTNNGQIEGLYYSTDGKIWTRSNITSGNFDSLSYANGIWVACNDSGRNEGIYYSTDGKVWTRSNITSGSYNSMCNANGIWVAGSDDKNGIYYSTDGKSWTQSNISSGSIYTVYNANGIWVAGSNSSNGLYYSTDGKSWTQSNISSGNFMCVYYANGVWITNSFDGKGLYYSTDGKVWTQSNITSRTIYYVYNANGVWVACSNSSGRGLYYSTDGKVWTQSNINECFSSLYSTVNIKVGVITDEDLYYSTDGKSWIQSNIGLYFRFAYYANGIWVAGGYSDKGLYYSTNGKSWNISNITSGGFRAVYNANGIWVAGSYANINGKGLYYSIDGKVWNQSNITNKSFSSIFNANGIWVAGGYNGNDGYGLYYSTNGKVWTQSNITSGNFYSVYYANGIWVAGSGINGLYYSTDGKSWTRSNITDSYIETVYYANGIWVAGSVEALYYSTNGKSWNISNITNEGFTSLYYANGIWVAGSFEGLYYSTNGKSWNISNIIRTNGFWTMIYYANGIWVAGESKYLYYSTDGKVWYEADTSGFVISKNPNSIYRSCLIESDADVEIYKYNSANRDLLGEVKRISLRENGDIINNYKPENTITYSGTKFVLDRTELYDDDIYVNGSYKLIVWYKQATDEPSQPSPGDDPSDKDKTIYNSAFYHF